MADTVIVPPAYNEIGHLEQAIGRIRLHAPQVYLLIVYGASPDGMGELAEKLAAVDPGLAVMQRQRKVGLGATFVAGFERAIDDGYSCQVEIAWKQCRRRCGGSMCWAQQKTPPADESARGVRSRALVLRLA